MPSRHLYTHVEARAAERREALEKGLMRRAGLLVAALAAAAAMLAPSMIPAARAADLAAPTVVSFTPSSGGDGTSVVITGTNFTGVTDVSFTLSSSLSFTVDSPTQITAQVPPNVYGPGKVRVANAAGTGASTTNFTPTAPFIYSFTPSSGPTGANVVISGNNLGSVTNVSLYYANATFTINSPTQITAQVPPNVPGPGRWRVTNPNGTGTSGGIFTSTAPIVSGFTPASGPSGSRVTITGSGFTGTTAVSLYFRPASFTVDSPTQITATVPPDVPGPGKWRVTTSNGMGQSANQYAPTSPAVNSFAPPSGPVGSKATLTGINLDGVTKVTLYFVDAAFVYNSPTSITVTIPPGVPGPGRFRVTTPRGLATSNDQFSVTTTTGSGPCGRTSAAPSGYQHVVWVVMENHGYGDIVGNASAPYENQLASQCGLATNYTAVTHPSLPNYIAATSGDYWGIQDNNPPSSHPLAVASIYSQVKASGRSWGEYEEDAPGNCPQASAYPYAVKHDPAAYYTSSSADCANWDVPMGSTSNGNFLNALNSGSLPAFSFITPNLCNDMHDCSIDTGDAWLQSWLSKIINSSAYQSGTTAIFLTYDEDDGSGTNQVYTSVIAPSVPAGSRSNTAYNHYSLLKTTEQLLALPYLAHAADSSTQTMAPAFNLLSGPGLAAPKSPWTLAFQDDFTGTVLNPVAWGTYAGQPGGDPGGGGIRRTWSCTMDCSNSRRFATLSSKVGGSPVVSRALRP